MAECVDEPNWDNGPRPGGPLSCSAYVSKGFCRRGEFVSGFEWASGQSYNFPEKSCCACGRANIELPKVEDLPPAKCHCRHVSVCSNYSLASFMLRLPEKVVSRASPWYDYLLAVYRTTRLTLPIDIRRLEAFYPALLPVPPCTKSSHYLLAGERRWHPEWRRLFEAASTSTQRSSMYCSASECHKWFPNPKPSAAAAIAFSRGRSYVRVAARNDSDARAFGHIVMLQRPNTNRPTRGTSMGPHKSHLKPPSVARDAKAAGSAPAHRPRYEWVEVSRTAFPGEGTRGYGCWFHPAVGSGVFVRINRSHHLTWVHRGLARQTILSWTAGVPQGGFRGDGDLPRLAAERGWGSLEILSSHGFTAGFEELGTTAPAHELVLMDSKCMANVCPCRVPKKRMCKCQLRTGCVPIPTRGGWNASAVCACDAEAHPEVINCAGHLPAP